MRGRAGVRLGYPGPSPEVFRWLPLRQTLAGKTLVYFWYLSAILLAWFWSTLRSWWVSPLLPVTVGSGPNYGPCVSSTWKFLPTHYPRYSSCLLTPKLPSCGKSTPIFLWGTTFPSFSAYFQVAVHPLLAPGLDLWGRHGESKPDVLRTHCWARWWAWTQAAYQSRLRLFCQSSGDWGILSDGREASEKSLQLPSCLLREPVLRGKKPLYWKQEMGRVKNKSTWHHLSSWIQPRQRLILLVDFSVTKKVIMWARGVCVCVLWLLLLLF